MSLFHAVLRFQGLLMGPSRIKSGYIVDICLYFYFSFFSFFFFLPLKASDELNSMAVSLFGYFYGWHSQNSIVTEIIP